MKEWLIKKKQSDDIIEQLLLNRDIPKSKWDAFLNPDFDRDLHNPFLMKDMKKAVEKIWQALEEDWPIGIFADYDADGVPGAAFLYETLGFIQKNFQFPNKSQISNPKLHIHIPTREDGYGLNKKAIDEFKKLGINLMITVDCGITSKIEIDYATKLGIKTIVIDHHEVVREKFPDAAFAVINPKQPECKYPFKELAACGVAFKLAQALIKRKTQSVSAKNSKLFESFLKWSLDLVAISTICDMVPLIDENRILAKYGLMVLRKTKRMGLEELYKIAGIDKEAIGTYAVGFQIGPRINAPGRMDHASHSFYLLASQEKDQSRELAKRLDDTNKKRQKELERVFKEAEEEIKNKNLDKNKIIVIKKEGWPEGVVGLVAGRIMEKYFRPVFVFRQTEKGLQGSARSIEKFHMIKELNKIKKYLLSFGGHARAAGLRLEKKNYNSFYKAILALAEKKLKDRDLIPILKIDSIINSNDISLVFYNKIKKFEPFGIGNPRPIFAIQDTIVDSIRTVGKEGKHLKLRITNHESRIKVFDAIGFDMGEQAKELNRGDKIDIAFSIDENVWNGRRKVQLKLCDIVLSS